MSKIWNRRRGGKEALAEKPSDFENPVGSNMACDCLSENLLLWTCFNH